MNKMENSNYPKTMTVGQRQFVVNNPQEEISVIKFMKQLNGEIRVIC